MFFFVEKKFLTVNFHLIDSPMCLWLIANFPASFSALVSSLLSVPNADSALFRSLNGIVFFVLSYSAEPTFRMNMEIVHQIYEKVRHFWSDCSEELLKCIQHKTYFLNRRDLFFEEQSRINRIWDVCVFITRTTIPLFVHEGWQSQFLALWILSTQMYQSIEFKMDR